MSRRKLTHEELNLWQRVTDQTKRLNPEIKPTEQLRKKSEYKISPTTPKRPWVALQRPSRCGVKKTSFDLSDRLEQRFATAPVRMDHKSFKKMKRGKLKPEARIDLHGMSLNRAHPALLQFILNASGSGKRLVLVITGKGRDHDDGGPIPTPRGILRHQVPQWLTTQPLNKHVIQFMPAHLSHGGDGAYYVYLKRQR